MRINDKGVLINYHDDPDVTRLVIPASVRRIAPHAMYGTEYLEEIVISEGVTEIGMGAFEGSHELKRVVLPDSVKTLGNAVFKDCHKLADVRLPRGISEIPDECFNNCIALASADIPDSVVKIGSMAFNSCIDLRDVRLPAELAEFGTYSFMETFSLRSIDIPDSVPEIPPMTFYRSQLKRVRYKGLEIFLGDDSEYSSNFSVTPRFAEMLGRGEFCWQDAVKSRRLPLVIAFYTKTRDPAAQSWIKRNFSKVMGEIIRTDNIPAAEVILEEGGFLSGRNIGRYIDLSLGLGKREIYLMLVGYKEKLGGYGDGKGRFRL